MENLNFKTSRGESRLNKHLVEQQKLSDENIKEIKRLHCEKDALYDKIEATGDSEILKEIEEIEYKLQDAWGFKRDRSYHRWFLTPGCKCPTCDNFELMGVGGNEGCYRIYNGDCPIHGKNLEN